MDETRYNNPGSLDFSQAGPSTQQSQITTAQPTAQPTAQATAQSTAQDTKTNKQKQVGRPEKMQTITKTKKP